MEVDLLRRPAKEPVEPGRKTSSTTFTCSSGRVSNEKSWNLTDTMRGESLYPNRSEHERHRPAVEKWSLGAGRSRTRSPTCGHVRKSRRIKHLSVDGEVHLAGRGSASYVPNPVHHQRHWPSQCMPVLSGLPGGHEIAIVIDLGGTSVQTCSGRPARVGHVDDPFLRVRPACLAPGNGPNSICLGGFRLQLNLGGQSGEGNNAA